MWWPGTGLNRRRRPFQGVNNLYLQLLIGLRGLPKYGEIRVKRANHGWGITGGGKIVPSCASRRRMHTNPSPFAYPCVSLQCFEWGKCYHFCPLRVRPPDATEELFGRAIDGCVDESVRDMAVERRNGDYGGRQTGDTNQADQAVPLPGGNRIIQQNKVKIAVLEPSRNLCSPGTLSKPWRLLSEQNY